MWILKDDDDNIVCVVKKNHYTMDPQLLIGDELAMVPPRKLAIYRSIMPVVVISERDINAMIEHIRKHIRKTYPKPLKPFKVEFMEWE